MEKVCIEFCNCLKVLRADSGLGQIAFAKNLGISQPVYARYEKGDREPDLNGLIKIARALDTTPNVLLGFEPPPLRDSAPLREIKTGDNSPVAIGNNITQTIGATKKPKTRK